MPGAGIYVYPRKVEPLHFPVYERYIFPRANKVPRERINGPGERYGTMRSYIKAGVGFDVAARSREFERKENYEPKEVTA